MKFLPCFLTGVQFRETRMPTCILVTSTRNAGVNMQNAFTCQVWVDSENGNTNPKISAMKTPEISRQLEQWWLLLTLLNNVLS